MPKYELQGSCFGPSIVGKKGDVVELSEEAAAPLGSTLKRIKDAEPKAAPKRKGKK